MVSRIVFSSRIGRVAWAMVRRALPYPDPLRRHRVRRQARALVVCDPWPEENATALDIAQLLLLRLLWLQGATRRALRWRQHDAAALLAREAVETCLTGLYWLFGNPDTELMRAQNAKSLWRLLMPIADGDPISPTLIGEVAAALASSTAQPPPLSEMAKIVAQHTNHSLATDLYRRLYTPLSTVYAHPTGLALERHVGRRRRLRDTPARSWSARSMRHAVDTCMATQALALAQRTDSNDELLASYADAHLNRITAPIVAIGARALLNGLRPASLFSAFRSLRGLLRYYDSGEAAGDPEPIRKEQTERFYEELLRTVGAEDELCGQLLLDSFAEITARLPDEETAPAG